VICCHGSGQGPHIDYWLPLMREISKHTKVLCYERRKIGQNTMAVSRSQTPEEAVSDLDALLKALQLRPPYILIAHSYGGAIARQFLQWHPTQVAGMVLAETGQETPIKHEAEQYKKQILGSKPLSVIHADSLLGKRGGSTSAEELRLRDLWAAEDERLKRAQLGLSSNARYVRVDDCGHDIIDERPHIVAAEVSWVLEN
ncbi:alpha/beta-hydrolase, partial [Cryphonectria parasitica EP155]